MMILLIYHLEQICEDMLVSPVSPDPRNAQNWVQFRFNSTGDITGDIIFQQIIYHRLRLHKFTFKINTLAISMVPGILYIVPLLRHLLSTIPATTKWNFERHLLLGHFDILAYVNFSLKENKWFMRQHVFRVQRWLTSRNKTFY